MNAGATDLAAPDVPLRRSVLFTPGMRGDRIEKAIAKRAADVVVADLEDAVAPQEKADARRVVHDAVAQTTPAAGGPERWVRINAWRGPWAVADLEATVPARPDAVVLPKAERRADLVALDLTLARLERAHDIGVGTTQVVAIVETGRGVENVEAIAAAPRVTAIAFGAEDLAADAGLKRTKESKEVAYGRSRVALAAAVRRVDALDQVFVDIDDTEGLEKESRFARTLGYRGKMVIHPKQVPIVHEAFSPSDEEVERARRVIDAVESADIGEGGVLRFEGRMIDVPLIQQARRVLAEAEAAESAGRRAA